MKSFVTLLKANAEDEKDNYMDLLKKENIDCQIIPVIDFKFCNLEMLKEKLNYPEKYSGLVLSSPRCVKALKECLQDSNLHEDWKRKYCFVVGPATENLTFKLFGLNCTGSNAGKGVNLVPIIIESLGSNKDLPLLMPISNIALDNIGLALNKVNILTDALVVYETIPHPQLVENISKLPFSYNISNILVFFSSSGVTSALPLISNENKNSCRMISIGTTTAEALKKSDIELVDICDKPTPESLLSIVKTLITS